MIRKMFGFLKEARLTVYEIEHLEKRILRKLNRIEWVKFSL